MMVLNLINRKAITTLFLFVIVNIAGYCQQMFLESINESTGLRNDGVNDIVQDKNGFVWIATLGGISKFDGKSLTNFSIQDGWPIESQTNKLLVDKNNVLWVATNDTCLFLVVNQNNEARKFYFFSSLAGVTDIVEDNDGTVWILSSSGLTQIKDYRISKTVHLKGVLLNFHCTQNKIYIASQQNGVYIYNRKTQIVEHIGERSGLLSNNCLSILFAEDKLYVGQQNGYSIIDNQGNIDNKNLGEHSRVTHIIQDKEKRIWMASYIGVMVYKNNILDYKFDESNNNFGNSYFTKIFFDYEDNIWLTSNGGGVFRTNSLNIVRYPSSIQNVEPVYGIIEENDSTYYQTYFGENLFVKMRLNQNVASYDTIRTNKTSPTFSAKNSISNTILLSGINGIDLIKNGAIREESDPKNFSQYFLYRSYFNSQDSAFYIGSFDGVTRYKDGKYRKIYYYTDKGKYPFTYSLCISSLGSRIFVASNFGILEIKNDTLVDVPEFNKIFGPDRMVYILYQDQNSNIWSCVNQHSILRFWIENNQIKYKFYDLLKLFGIRGPLNFHSFENVFWMRSQDKIYQLDLKSLYDEKPVIQTILDEHDNLKPEVAHNTTFSIDSKDNLWIAGAYGVIKYKYKYQKKNNSPTINNILNITLKDNADLDKFANKFDSKTGLPLNLILPNHLNEISFEFIGICHQSQKEVLYRTRLVSLNSNWSQPTHQSSITYNNLSPGRYTFQFISCNNDGLWNKEPYTFSFTILPAWYQTWWFKVIAALAFATFIYAIFLWRISILKKEKNRQIKLTQDILTSQEQERKRLAQDLHDGVGQELSMLKVNIEKIKNEPILSKVNKIIEDIRFLSRNIHPHYFEKLGLTKAVEMIVDETNNLEKIFWVHELENIDAFLNSNQQLMLYRVIQECMNNTIKHSGAKNAKITITAIDQIITILIQDNGIGFNVNVEKLNSLGLSTIRERVRSLDGEVRISSKPGKGTETEIILPIKALKDRG